MTTERRQSSPEYRERVHRVATALVEQYGGDYDAALDRAREQAARYPGGLDTGVLSLLRRRAATVNCPQPR